ncbi:MAG TPA: tetratricopeptide repeat protein, partial [Phycisphaerae bacterium]
MIHTFSKPNLFDKAVESHRAGRMPEAETLYRELLRDNPQHADALHMLGLLYYQRGDRQAGADMIERSIAFLPTNPSAFSNLGEVKRSLGRLDEAEKLCRHAIKLHPDLAAAHVNLAMTLHQMGKAGDALPHALRAIELNPKEAGGYAAAALALTDTGRFSDAIRYYDEAIKLNPNDPATQSGIAMCHVRVEANEKAIVNMKRAVALAPDNPQILLNMGSLMAQLEKFEESAMWLEKTLEKAPNMMIAIEHLAGVRTGQKRFQDSIDLCRRIIAINPNALDTYATMGEAMMNLGQFDECIAAMKTALQIRPWPSVLQSLSNAYVRMGNPEAGIETINQALAMDPQNAILHFNKSIILMLLGRLQEAWGEYEWRWQHPRMVGRTRRFGVPQWDGRQLNGARILLHAEQGLGDTIFFGRYVSKIAEERGGKPIMWVQTSVVEIAKTIPGVHQVIGEHGTVPAFDTHLPIMSLPRIFNTTLETVPNK